MTNDISEHWIDGYKYEMTLLGATQGYRLFHRLVRLVGPAAGKLFASLESGGDGASIQNVDLSSDAFADGLKALTSGVHETDLDHIINELRKQSSVSVDQGGNKMVPLASVFDLHFRGRLGSLFSWLGWGLKVQFADFFDAFANMTAPSEGGASQAQSEAHR